MYQSEQINYGGTKDQSIEKDRPLLDLIAEAMDSKNIKKLEVLSRCLVSGAARGQHIVELLLFIADYMENEGRNIAGAFAIGKSILEDKTYGADSIKAQIIKDNFRRSKAMADRLNKINGSSAKAVMASVIDTATFVENCNAIKMSVSAAECSFFDCELQTDVAKSWAQQFALIAQKDPHVAARHLLETFPVAKKESIFKKEVLDTTVGFAPELAKTDPILAHRLLDYAEKQVCFGNCMKEEIVKAKENLPSMPLLPSEISVRNFIYERKPVIGKELG